LLQYLDNNKITPELDKIYRERCGRGLKKIEKLEKRARIYQRRKESRFKIFVESKRSIALHFVAYALVIYLMELGGIFAIIIWEILKRNLQRKAWNELTQNGKFGLEEILDKENGGTRNPGGTDQNNTLATEIFEKKKVKKLPIIGGVVLLIIVLMVLLKSGENNYEVIEETQSNEEMNHTVEKSILYEGQNLKLLLLIIFILFYIRYCS